MIKSILEATKQNLEGEMSKEERSVAEMLMFRILQTMREYRTMIPIATDYISWFAEYQRERAINNYTDNQHDKNIRYWE